MYHYLKSPKPNGFALVSILVCLALFSLMMAAALRAQLTLSTATRQAYAQRQAYNNASTGAAVVAAQIEDAVLLDEDIPDGLDDDDYSVDVTQVTETKYKVEAVGFQGTTRAFVIRYVSFDESYLAAQPTPTPAPSIPPCDKPRWARWKQKAKCKVKQNHGHHYHGYGHHHD